MRLAFKWCPGCETTLPRSAFHIHRGRLDGLQTRCRRCQIDRVRVNNLRYNYGLTEEQYEALLRDQGGVCAICGKVDGSGRRLSVDHCHTTGQVRGLLCNGCNTSLGGLKDSPENMGGALIYLTAHGNGMSTEDLVAFLTTLNNAYDVRGSPDKQKDDHGHQETDGGDGGRGGVPRGGPDDPGDRVDGLLGQPL